MHSRTFHKFFLYFWLVAAFLRITKKWYVPIVIAAICLPGPVKATDEICREIGSEADHGAFVVNEAFAKNFNHRGLLFIDGDFIGVVLSEDPLSFGEGVTELGSSSIEFFPLDSQKRSFDAYADSSVLLRSSLK